MIAGYESGLSQRGMENAKRPEPVGLTLRNAIRRTWKHLAEERIRDCKPNIPLGNSFWPLEKTERSTIRQLFMQEDVRKLTTMLRCRKDRRRGPRCGILGQRLQFAGSFAIRHYTRGREEIETRPLPHGR